MAKIYLQGFGLISPSRFISLSVFLLVFLKLTLSEFEDRPRLMDLSAYFKNIRNEVDHNLINLPLSHEIPPYPIPDVSPLCEEILEDLSTKASNFTYCVTSNARPITMCRKCFEFYNQFDSVYQNISKNNDNDCQNELLNRDKVMIVQTVYQYIDSLWIKAQCENCLTRNSNETLLSNETLVFFVKLDNVNQCILQNKAEEYNSTNIKDVCGQCRDSYVDLNMHYDSLNTKFNNEVCMDIVDAMNITHHLWSNKYHCTQFNFEGYPVLILSGIIGIIPLFFYLINRFASSARESEIVIQKRMSFVHSSYSISNSLQR